MKFIKGFFENYGEPSMTRLLSLLFSIAAMYAGLYTLVILHDITGSIATFTAYSGVALSIKLGQKYMEVKNETKPEIKVEQ